MQQSFRKRNQGFTLFELVVVLGMLSLVAVLTIVNFRQGERQRRVNLAVDNVISGLRLAQNYALSGRQIPGGLPVVSGLRCSGQQLSNAAAYYRVKLSYSNTFDIEAVDTCGAVMLVQQYRIIDKTRIKPATGLKLDTGSGDVAQNGLYVIFKPPFALMTAGANAGAAGNFVRAKITVELSDGDRPRTVVVDGISGRIE